MYIYIRYRYRFSVRFFVIHNFLIISFCFFAFKLDFFSLAFSTRITIEYENLPKKNRLKWLFNFLNEGPKKSLLKPFSRS